MFTHFFIDRPILSAVISLLIVLAGGVAMSVAPIEQYPELAPPQVSINARYPGATAEVIASQVAAPIEAQLNGVDNLLYFQSTSSSSGNVSIAVVFKPGSNPDINQVNVQNRVSQAMSQLPQAVVQQGVTVDKQSSSIMMVLTIYSPDERYSSTYIDNYTNLYVLDELKRVPGANRATVMGLPNIAMRVWLQPDRMAQLGITVREVAQAIQSQNQTFGIGQIGGQPTLPGTQQNFVVTAQGLLTDPKEFESIIVRAAKEGTAIVRLRDIGRVELDKQDYSIASRMNGKIGTTIAIYQQPGANAVATATAVRARLEELKAQFPTGLDYRVALDTSLFTLNSIEKVVHDILRGGGAGRPCGVRVPAVAARDRHPDPRRAGVDHRHLHRHAPARLLDQHADPVRPDPGHRPRGRRCHRRGRERRGQHDGQGPDGAARRPRKR